MRDFIKYSRQILIAQISIDDKNDETDLLKEYIIMEKEKLDEGKKTFQEDKDKYEKFKQDLQAQSNLTEEQLRNTNRQIENLELELKELHKHNNYIKSQETRCVEDLQLYKRDKTFLDLLAISQGLKTVQRQSRKQDHLLDEKSDTFLTQVNK